MSFDRARRVALGTRVVQLEHVPERIWAGFTSKNSKFD